MLKKEDQFWETLIKNAQKFIIKSYETQLSQMFQNIKLAFFFNSLLLFFLYLLLLF